LTILAAALRFSTLDVQTFWIDESVTVGLLRLDFSQMLRTIPDTESTPPLYYVVAWLWTRVFGRSEFGLRSLSAVAGTITIPVIYAAAARLAQRRTALFAAGLAAVSPVLVWYSQEARAYSLLVLLAALTLLFAVRALERQSISAVVLWAVSSVLAVCTHYFAGFFVLGELLWLLTRPKLRRSVALACIPLAATAVALSPLLLHQREQGHLDFIARMSLSSRLIDSAKVFVVGQTGPKVQYVAWLGLAIAAVAIVLAIARRRDPGMSRLAFLLVVACSSVAIPVAAALIGSDYILPRNLLAVFPAVAILVAAGVTGSARRGLASVVGVALIVLSVAMCVAVPLDPKLRREAINAQILRVNAQDAAATIVYVPVSAGRTSDVTADCPDGYRAYVGRAEWLSDSPGAEPVSAVPSVPPGRGWRAFVDRPPAVDRTFRLTVGCLPR
jgi:uncharacterized membrane protein